MSSDNSNLSKLIPSIIYNAVGRQRPKDVKQMEHDVDTCRRRRKIGTVKKSRRAARRRVQNRQKLSAQLGAVNSAVNTVDETMNRVDSSLHGVMDHYWDVCQKIDNLGKGRRVGDGSGISGTDNSTWNKLSLHDKVAEASNEHHQIGRAHV